MSKPRKHVANPEFGGLEEFVWEGLNHIGKSIRQIEEDETRSIMSSPAHEKTKDKPIWHSKAEIDEFVARSLNLKIKDYGADLGRNQLYKAIANEIGRLRRAGVIVDWIQIKKRNTGMGVWRLDKTKLDEFVYRKVRREIKSRNFHSRGDMCMVVVRQKQEAFRKELFSEYGKCALCGFKIPEYMIGAHIVPYAIMRVEDPGHAMDPSNGLLLCRFCDVAFDNGSITIEGDMGIEISDRLRDQRSPIVRSWLKPIPGELHVRPDAKYPPNPIYLRWKIDLLGTRS